MYKIRKIQYATKSVSIQVYRIENRKRKIIRHIGTAHNDQELENLIELARAFIEKVSKQLVLFENQPTNKIINLSQYDYLGIYYSFYYELIHKLIIVIGFDKLKINILLDLVIIRMFEPTSKLRSIELIWEYFGVKHRRQSYYDVAPEVSRLKKSAEKIVLDFAKKNYSFEYDLLFYDVTTLYFETFEEDNFRKNGFSKDNKSQQPQILVALMVSKEGFPISYEVFSGNTFEGHTIIPVIKDFISKNKVNAFTIVADAAMISSENIKALLEQKINYIVGARLGNISKELFEKIDTSLLRKDGRTIRIKTENGYLICSYSDVRYRKDKYEMNNQLEKAKKAILQPSKSKKLKFTVSKEKKLELNHSLIQKTEKLLGIKGYYTNIEESIASNQLIINHYLQLFKVEQAFRMSKSDLQARPIFHFKEDPIKLHILICFIALVVSKHIELKTNTSIKNFIHQCKKVTDARIINKITNKEYNLRAVLSDNFFHLFQKLFC